MSSVTVIFREKRVNRIMVERDSMMLGALGFEVFIKNGDGKFILAVIGEGSVPTDRITGIKGIQTGDSFFESRRHEFVPAREYFRE